MLYSPVEISSSRYDGRPQSTCKHCGLGIYQNNFGTWIHKLGASFDGYGYVVCGLANDNNLKTGAEPIETKTKICLNCGIELVEHPDHVCKDGTPAYAHVDVNKGGDLCYFSCEYALQYHKKPYQGFKGKFASVGNYVFNESDVIHKSVYLQLIQPKTESTKPIKPKTKHVCTCKDCGNTMESTISLVVVEREPEGRKFKTFSP